MTPERWQQIRDVLEKALELTPSQRAAFLDGACLSDPSLRREVETLLASSADVRSSFLESSSLRVTITPGTKLGEYEVKSLLGSGGMGEVYRARDSRLGRDVAIKVLPSFLSTDSDRLRRFEQEARAAAALNHPNILAVFQMGTYQGAPYLVSELLERETLREQIKRGRLPIRKSIDYGVQIARGLAAAHEKGIVHRDLKPENLFVTKDGRVKILDFGLAKLTQPQSGSDNSALTLTKGTEAGMVMGTAGYMAPEQVRGETADYRADIFAFGAILYEMLAGKRAFQKPTSAETMTAILNEDPPGISQVTTNLPPALQRVVHRCLEKNPEQRFQSSSDLAFALDALSENAGSATVYPRKEGGETGLWAFIKQHKLWMGAGLLLTCLLLVAVLYSTRNLRLSSVPHAKKEIHQRELTANPPDNAINSSALSRDGKYLAYTDSAGSLFALQVDTRAIRPLLSGSAQFFVLDWYPDGNHLLVLGTGQKSGIWKLSSWDGTSRKISDEFEAATVSPDGLHIAALKKSGIWLMGVDGEDLKPVVHQEPGSYIAGFDWSPSGRRIAYTLVKPSGESAIETTNLDGNESTTVLSEPRLHGSNGFSEVTWLPDGRILFTLSELPPNQRDGNIWAIGTDPNSGRVLGKPERVTNWVGFTMGTFAHSMDGRRLVFRKTRTQDVVKVAELIPGSGKLSAARRLTLDNQTSWVDGWTRDGHAILFTSVRDGRSAIYKQIVQGTDSEPLVSGPESYNFPVMSPDGSWLLYTAHSGQDSNAASYRLMRMPAAGGPPAIILQGSFDYDCAAPPSTLCVLGERRDKKFVISALDPIGGRGPDLASVELPLGVREMSLSPEGKNIALIRDDDSAIYIVGLEKGALQRLDLKEWKALQSARWSANGRRIYVGGMSQDSSHWAIFTTDLAGNINMLVEVKGGQGWLYGPRPSPDGRFLAYTERLFESNVSLLEDF